MHILILGASSFIGTALAESFALNNSLLLVGRNIDRLIKATNKCTNAGAAQVGYVEQDFRLGVSNLLQAIGGNKIDLIVDVASASSSKRDSEIESSEITDLVSADFVSRAKIFEHILNTQDGAPRVILISTVLTLVKSPGRSVYSTLKGLYETYLIRLKGQRSISSLLVVYVGTVIDTNHESKKATKLASAVVRAFDNKKEWLFYGLSGMFLLSLFYLQPVIFHLVTLTQRKIRKWAG